MSHELSLILAIAAFVCGALPVIALIMAHLSLPLRVMTAGQRITCFVVIVVGVAVGVYYLQLR